MHKYKFLMIYVNVFMVGAKLTNHVHCCKNINIFIRLASLCHCPLHKSPQNWGFPLCSNEKGLSHEGMPCEFKVSTGREAACSFLRVTRNADNKNVSQSCLHLMSTDPAPDTAQHFMWNISVKYQFIDTKSHALNHEHLLLEVLVAGEVPAMSASQLASSEVPDTWQHFPTIDIFPQPSAIIP